MKPPAIAQTVRVALIIASAVFSGALTCQGKASDWPPIAPAASENYTWKNVEIEGGGFVTGIIFHPTGHELLYARTDVGGVFRFDREQDRWIALNDSIPRSHWQWSGIDSIALDPADSDRIYAGAGSYFQNWGQPGALLRSSDRGATWDAVPLPFKLSGNSDGRNMGERLLVQPNAPNQLWLGSLSSGLWKSEDRGSTWTRVTGLPHAGITAVWSMPVKDGSPGTIMVALAMTTSEPIWRTIDGGATWSEVPGQPSGFLVHRTCVDVSGDLFVTYGNGPGPNGVTAGALWRFEPSSERWTNLTPSLADGAELAPHGFAGIAADPKKPGVLLVASLNRWKLGNQIWRTTDGGKTWRSCFEGANWDHKSVEYTEPLKPHWMADIAIDPHDGRRVWFVTGYGVWTTDDIAPDGGRAISWRFENRGLEETVAEELISPPSGAPLLSALGDLGGFRHVTLDESPSAGALQRNRGSSSSIAFAGLAPEVIVRTHSGPARGAMSRDGGLNWSDFASTPRAARDNGAGSLVINSDATRLIWLPKGDHVQVSADGGKSWHKTTHDYTSPRNHLTARLAADTVDPLLVYLYDPSNGRFMVGKDGGERFSITQMFATEGGIIRAEPRQRGVVWVPTSDGLYVSSESGGAFRKLAAPSAAYQVGFGHAAPGHDRDSVFLLGRIGEAEGLFRSDDSGETWIRIDDPELRYGWIRAITGDGQIYGRVYLGTSGRGILVGEPAGGRFR